MHGTRLGHGAFYGDYRAQRQIGDLALAEMRPTVKGGRWAVRVRALRRGTTRFTARALAGDGRTAKASRRVKLR